MGPVLSFEVQETLVPVVPAPKVEGMEAEFVHDDEETYPETPLPSSPPGTARASHRGLGADVPPEAVARGPHHLPRWGP